DQDRPLKEDVRWLSSCLGNVIRKFEGQEVFEAVEFLRVSCRSRRRGQEGHEELPALFERVHALPLETTLPVARSFTLFFMLINTAEQVHRVRRHREHLHGTQPAGPTSIPWTLARLKEMG